MMDMDAVRAFAERHGLWVVEDAAHAFPAAYRRGPAAPWRRCGENTAAVTCFSFYANKTITTGEGGMAVTDDPTPGRRACGRCRCTAFRTTPGNATSGNSAWDYRIVAAGFKYNLTDIAAAIGNGQLRRAEEMRQQREAIARVFPRALADVEQIELPPAAGRPHPCLAPVSHPLAAWSGLRIDRNRFIEKLRARGGSAVRSTGGRCTCTPTTRSRSAGGRTSAAATRQWPRMISLPLFPGMRRQEQEYVADTVRELSPLRHAKA